MGPKEKTGSNQIISEVRAAREKHAARFNYDLEKIFEDIITRQKVSGRKYVRFPAKLIEPEELARNLLQFGGWINEDRRNNSQG